MLTKKSKSILKMLALTSLVLPNIAWSASESCNALMNLGLYNVAQSSNAADGQSMSKSTFCSFDYSLLDKSSTQAAAIKGSYGPASGAASASASDSEIQQTQKSICTSGFNSSAYSNQASAYSRTVYQGSLDAWNKCQTLANKGLVFDIQPSSTLQGVSVSITAPTGLAAKFYGLTQYGVGHSDCSMSANGKLLNVGSSTPFRFTAASKVTINCTRQMEANGQDLIADAQDLVFVTSADNLTVPLAGIGSLARSTVDQIKADISANTQIAINQAVSPISSNVSGLTSQVNSLSTNFNNQIPTLQSQVSTLRTGKIFGGIYQVELGTNTTIVSNDLFTGLANCPAGFTAIQISQVHDAINASCCGSVMYLCYKNP